MKYLFLLLLLASCSTRKVETNKEVLKEENKIELTDKTITKTEDTTSTKIVEDGDILIIEPIDSTQPIVIDNGINIIKYHNSKIRHEKKKVVSDIQNKKIVEKKADIAVKIDKKKDVVVKKKKIEKTTNFLDYWWLYLIIGIILFIVYKIKDKIWWL